LKDEIIKKTLIKKLSKATKKIRIKYEKKTHKEDEI